MTAFREALSVRVDSGEMTAFWEALSEIWSQTQQLAAQYLRDPQKRTGAEFLNALAMFYAQLPVVRPPTQAERARAARAQQLYLALNASKNPSAWAQEVAAMAKETVNTPDPTPSSTPPSSTTSQPLLVVAAAGVLLLLGWYIVEQQFPRRSQRP